MKHLGLTGFIGLTILTACNTTPVQMTTPTRVLGAVELSLDSGGVSSVRFANRSSTLREADVVFGTGTTNVITTTSDPFDYLVAKFPVSHAGSSTSAFNNLTLYAEAVSGNIGSTAIKTITNFGGVTNTAEQTRLAKLVAPVHAVTTDVPGNIVLDNTKADFQAFTITEVTAAKNLAIAGSAMTNSDALLNYGFSARCDTTVALNCTANSRLIAVGKTGFITLALRVPKSTSAYKFVMNFIVMDESVSRVTRSVYPPDDVGDAENRANTLVGASEIMQFGLNRYNTSLNNVSVDDVSTSSLGASIFALGIGRISAGDSHSCGLDATGTAYCWGDNTFGKLGNGTIGGTSNVPVAVSTTVKFSSIVTGDLSTCALSVAGDAYCWGSNFAGRLGNNSTFDSSIPVLVSDPSAGPETYSSISASNGHTCVLSLVKAAYCWGDNGNGRLGDGTTTNRLIPTLVSDPVAGAQEYSKISAGYSHTCAITVSDFAYCWGLNASGQLGDGTNTDSSIPVLVSTTSVYSSISAGNDFSCAINATGVAECWGLNDNGALGNNSFTNSNVPVTVSNPSAGAVSYSSITTGGFHSCAISVAGDAYCWGANTDGEIGNGTNSDVQIPTLVSPPSTGGVLYTGMDSGTFHSCAVSTTGNAFCWGYGSSGRLGYNSPVSSNVPIRDAATSLTL